MMGILGCGMQRGLVVVGVGGGGGMDGAISHNIQGLNKTNISDNFYVSQALQCGHLATDCCSRVSRKKCDATQVLIPPFVSAESLMSAAQIISG